MGRKKIANRLKGTYYSNFPKIHSIKKKEISPTCCWKKNTTALDILPISFLLYFFSGARCENDENVCIHDDELSLLKTKRWNVFEWREVNVEVRASTLPNARQEWEAAFTPMVRPWNHKEVACHRGWVDLQKKIPEIVWNRNSPHRADRPHFPKNS